MAKRSPAKSIIAQSASRNECGRFSKEQSQDTKKSLVKDRDWLYAEYVEAKKSSGTIAKEVGCTDTHVFNWLKVHGIERRPLSEALKGRPNPLKGTTDPARKLAMQNGERFYFTGKPCLKGHVDFRYTSDKKCVVCREAYSKEWRVENKDRHREMTRNWAARNLERYTEMKKSWYARNIEHVKDYDRERNSLEENKEKTRQQHGVWRNNNRDLVRSFDQKRRAKKAGADGSFDASDIAKIRSAQKDKCAYCKVKLKGKGHIDHIIALSKGGTNWPRNLQLTCKPCNCSKHNKDPIEYANRIGMLL